MPKITISQVRSLSMPEELPWQEADALSVVKSFLPDMRPGDTVEFKQLLHATIRMQLKWDNVKAGIDALIEKDVLQLTERERLMLTEAGFAGHWRS